MQLYLGPRQTQRASVSAWHKPLHCASASLSCSDKHHKKYQKGKKGLARSARALALSAPSIHRRSSSVSCTFHTLTGLSRENISEHPSLFVHSPESSRFLHPPLMIWQQSHKPPDRRKALRGRVRGNSRPRY